MYEQDYIMRMIEKFFSELNKFIHDHFRTTLSQLDPNCTYKFTKPSNVYHESKITIRFWIVTILLAAITIITLKIR